MSRWREPGATHPMCRMEALDVAMDILNTEPATPDLPLVTVGDLNDFDYVIELLDCVRHERDEDLCASGWVETEDTERNGALARALTVLLS